VKYAIFGGSFNPIHNGHIIIVQKMLDYIQSIKMLFIVPAACSPFKRELEDLVPFETRYDWCTRVFSKVEGTKTLDIERNENTDTPSYTYQTIERFKTIYQEYPLLIIGEDSLVTFHKWKKFERILERCELAVFKRRGYGGKSKIDDKYLQKITVYDTPYIEISSTEIRERLSGGKSIKGYVPETLETDIIEEFNKMSDMNDKD